MSKAKSTSRKRSGQSITEVLIGGMILVPIVLAIIDLAVVVMGGELVNDLAKQAARGAANAKDNGEATNPTRRTLRYVEEVMFSRTMP